MTLPTAYLTSVKNLDAFFSAIRTAKAPEKFTIKFLEALDFKSTNDRLIIGVLKALGFLDGEGRPQDRYFKFLDETQSATVLGEAIQDAYSDLFQINKNAHQLNKTDIVNKAKTLSQGQMSESVLDKFAMTFLSLSKLASFSPKITKIPAEKDVAKPTERAPEKTVEDKKDDERKLELPGRATIGMGGLHYNIQIILPDSRDPKVYDALFRSLKEHLF